MELLFELFLILAKENVNDDGPSKGSQSHLLRGKLCSCMSELTSALLPLAQNAICEVDWALGGFVRFTLDAAKTLLAGEGAINFAEDMKMTLWSCLSLCAKVDSSILTDKEVGTLIIGAAQKSLGSLTANVQECNQEGLLVICDLLGLAVKNEIRNSEAVILQLEAIASKRHLNGPVTKSPRV